MKKSNTTTAANKEAIIQSVETVLCQKEYAFYVEFAHRPVGSRKSLWLHSTHLDYLCNNVQSFIESDTGHAFDILILQCPPQHGKLCSDDTPVPTPNGWVMHGDLRVGDYVFGRDGKSVRILAELNKGQEADYLVSFSDGGSIQVHGAHEWVVYDRKHHKECVYETRQMAEWGLWYQDGTKLRTRFSVDHNTAIHYDAAEVPVHPYFLGLWLGDGTTTKPAITMHPDDVEPIKKIRNLGFIPSTICTHSTTGINTYYFCGQPSAAMKTLGLGYRKGLRKHIPTTYKQASIEQRLELIAGMIDSDGYIYSPNGRVTISNTNKTLIDDFAEVCRSLGWRCTISAATPKLSSSKIQGKQTIYQLTFQPDMEIPTALPRKHTTHLDALRRSRGIVSVERCEPQKGKCITVEGGVYLVGKTMIPTHNSQSITETLPSWYLGKWPDKRVIIASYNEDTAERFCRRNKQKIREVGERLFGLKISKDVDRATEFEVEGHVGQMLSRGLSGGITGNPANLFIIDDPIKNRSEADSDTTRDSQWAEWLNSIKTRLASGAKVIVILTRWHEDDIAGRILANEKNVTLINLPCEAEENDPLGRKPGDALFPEIGKDNQWLAEFKAGYQTAEGARAWYALFQGHPSAAEGGLIKRSWWRYYNKLPDYFDEQIQSWDCTFKDSSNSDFVVGTVWGRIGGSYYLLDLIKKRMDIVQTMQEIQNMTAKWPKALLKLIEDKANGPAVIQMLRTKVPGIVAVNPQGGKAARVSAVSPAIEAGNVYLPEQSLMPWVGEFVEECSAFPTGTHDDQVDSMSQALNRLIYNTKSSFKAPDKHPINSIEARLERQIERLTKKKRSVIDW